MSPQPPVIVVPGIKGTSLADHYHLPPEDVWRPVFQEGFMDIAHRASLRRIALHPDNRRREAMEPARVLPGAIHEFVYGELVEELRHELAEEEPHPVFPFAYDWREDISVSADRLALFAGEVAERVGLMRGEHRGYAGPVDIVCHSMGGLVAADCVHRHGESGLFRKVVSLGTPFKGSVEAVWKLTTGRASQWMRGPARERAASRTIPSVYQLLPSYRGAVVSKEAALRDLFKTSAWQRSVINSLRDFIKEYEARARPEELLESFLNRARRLRGRVNSKRVMERLAAAGGGWLAIVGIDCDTYVNIKSARENGGVRFIQTGRENGYASDPASRLTGDNTVPFGGAAPGFLKIENLVCVTKEDFGFFEFEKLLDLHTALPRMDLAQRMAIKFLKNKPFYLPEGGRPAPGIPRERWEPPIGFDS
ncbi:MAG: esterase/lipase family protein [Candidatus Nitrospinota bacterium M3_3B_026]